jgi:hypothetical protein
MAIKPAGETQYGDISSAPGRRTKVQKFDTSVGDKDLVLTSNPKINVAKAAIAASVIADRAVTGTATGLATRFEVIQGRILTVTLTNGGADYDAGTYTAVPLTGGTGTGATATIVVGSGGNVTSVTLVAGGSGYNVGNTLSADDADLGGGGGSGLVITVATTSGPINA